MHTCDATETKTNHYRTTNQQTIPDTCRGKRKPWFTNTVGQTAKNKQTGIEAGIEGNRQPRSSKTDKIDMKQTSAQRPVRKQLQLVSKIGLRINQDPNRITSNSD